MPIHVMATIGRYPFPQNRVTHGTDAQRSATRQIVFPRIMAVTLQLRVVAISHTVHGTFDAAPHFKRRLIIVGR